LYPDKNITVAVTPNGLADGITKNESNGRDYFVMPEEKLMTFNDFIDKLDNPRSVVKFIHSSLIYYKIFFNILAKTFIIFKDKTQI